MWACPTARRPCGRATGCGAGSRCCRRSARTPPTGTGATPGWQVPAP
jgi:hypothetical protein